MATKDRLLFILKYLFIHTDEEHPVSLAELKEELSKNGYGVNDTRTIRDDIDTIRGAGFDIVTTEKTGVSTLYRFGDRCFDRTEMRIIIDALSAARFLSVDQTRKIVRKTHTAIGHNNVERVMVGVSMPGHLKTKNDQVLNIVQLIREGIHYNRKIRFIYYKQLVPENLNEEKGELTMASPLGLIWQNDRYHMIAYVESKKAIRAFKVERMSIPDLMDEKRTVPGNHAEYREYIAVEDEPEMTETKEILMECKAAAMDAVLERYGDNVGIRNGKQEGYEVTVRDYPTKEFMAWVFRQNGKARILQPQDVKQAYTDMLKRCLEGTEE